MPNFSGFLVKIFWSVIFCFCDLNNYNRCNRIMNSNDQSIKYKITNDYDDKQDKKRNTVKKQVYHIMIVSYL